MSNWYERDPEWLEKKPKGPRPALPKMMPGMMSIMRSYLGERNLSHQDAVRNGWYPTNKLDGYDRIVIPCTNTLDVPYFQARAIDSWAAPRYHSPAATREDSIVICWPAYITGARGAVIVEGPMDALAACGCNYVGIGLMGNRPNEAILEHIYSIVKLHEPVIVVPDADHTELAPLLITFLASRKLRVSGRFPVGKDLAGMSKKQREKLLAL